MKHCFHSVVYRKLHSSHSTATQLRVLPSANFHCPSTALSHTQSIQPCPTHNPNNCLISSGIQKTCPGATLLHFLAPTLTFPPTPPHNFIIKHISHQQKWVLCKHSGTGFSTPSFALWKSRAQRRCSLNIDGLVTY